jgi:hypothetical protein
MAGKGGPSSHGGIAFLKRGVLPTGKKYIARQVDSIMAEMVQDLGGEGEVTAAQKIIISTIRQNLVFIGLVAEWIAAQPSIIDDAGQVLAPLSAFFLAAENSVVRACRELGLKRVAPVQSLEGYLKMKAQAAATAQTTPATSPRQGKGKSSKCARFKSDPEAQGGGE